MHRLALWPTLHALAALMAAVSGCERADEGKQPRTRTEEPEPQVLIFPSELHADDESVNDFICQVIDVCASGDYDAFRLLWSIREDPFPQDQFERAWQSVQRVTVTGLRRVQRSADRSTLYAVRAVVELDPDVREPRRDVTILLIEENGQWRMTTPPKDLPADLFESRSPTTQPQGESDAAGAG